MFAHSAGGPAGLHECVWGASPSLHTWLQLQAAVPRAHMCVSSSGGGEMARSVYNSGAKRKRGGQRGPEVVRVQQVSVDGLCFQPGGAGSGFGCGESVGSLV